MKNFDIEKYQGSWYELGKYKFRWQPPGTCPFAKAEYVWDNKNKVMLVTNSCLDQDRNIVDVRKAVAWVPVNENLQRGKFLIKFNDGRPSDPVGEYIVLWTDYSSYSFVSSQNSEEAFWILSRTPKVPKADIKFILNKVVELGYDINKVITNPSNFY